MDHIAYLDAKSNEFENLLSGKKTMIIRGAAGRKVPYGIVSKDDILYFINNNGEGKIVGKAQVKSVHNSEKMSPDESSKLIDSNQTKLLLSDSQLKRWRGKRYIVLIEIFNFMELTPFTIDRSKYGNMDDWLPVKDIINVKI